MMIDYSYFHELETIELNARSIRSISDLLPIFKSLKFTLYEDVVYLDRKKPFPLWQSSSIVSVDVLLGGKQVYGFRKGKWDSIHLHYLLATLPFELADCFIDVAFKIASQLQIEPIYRGNVVTENDVRLAFSSAREELIRETYCEPGSEWLRAMIAESYPRRG